MKMKESLILKIALISSLIGLIALYLISSKIEIKDYKPPSLNKNIGEDVKLNGIVTKITDRGNVVFIDVKHQNQVNVVLFTDKDIPLKAGDSVEITGTVQEYNGKTEIIAEEIRVVK